MPNLSTQKSKTWQSNSTERLMARSVRSKQILSYREFFSQRTGCVHNHLDHWVYISSILISSQHHQSILPTLTIWTSSIQKNHPPFMHAWKQNRPTKKLYRWDHHILRTKLREQILVVRLPEILEFKESATSQLLWLGRTKKQIISYTFGKIQITQDYPTKVVKQLEDDHNSIIHTFSLEHSNKVTNNRLHDTPHESLDREINFCLIVA